VLRQSLQQWEWIIVNDGSDDAATLRVLDALRAVNDPRVRVVDQPNCGLPAARNAGVAVSRAPLLFFLDSDDLIAPTALEQLAWTLTTHPECVAAVATWCVFIRRDAYRVAARLCVAPYVSSRQC
jgi:glycosyltransferase involved in cell wall biosynthesis